MNDFPHVAAQAEVDRLDAMQRDYAEWCKRLHDSYIRAGFSTDHSMELVLHRLDQLSGWCSDV